MLLATLQSTLSPDNDTRQRAEAQLQYLGNTPGFGIALLELALGSDGQMPLGVRQLAAVYLKKFIRECWAPEVGQSRFTPQEKAVARNHLLRGLHEQSTTRLTSFKFFLSGTRGFCFILQDGADDAGERVRRVTRGRGKRQKIPKILIMHPRREDTGDTRRMSQPASRRHGRRGTPTQGHCPPWEFP